jgi:hypothetical protein
MFFRPLRCLAAASLLSTTFATASCAVPVAAEGEPQPEEAVESAASRAAKVPGIKLVVTVDWEGDDLTDANLRAMEDFRAGYPDVKIVHFLNAAYFTKPGADAAEVNRSIRRALRTGDELGLHIHGWKRLFEASGVTFRSGPTFWGDTLTAADCKSDCGHEVPISLYTATELEKVMAFSVETLSSHGLGHATSFRAGGWLAGDTVRAALSEEGFAYDHSSVPPGFLANELRGEPLLDWVRGLWTGTTASMQPYRLGALTEIPDNGALADYVTSREMLTVVDGAIATLKKTPGADRVVSIGFHQETATDYLPRVAGALDGIAQRVASGKVTVRYVTSREAAAAR